jgi:plasmid stability protein
MHHKQKLTVYVPSNLHRQLKIKAAIEDESMSAMVAEALSFYLQHPEVIAATEAKSHGQNHQIHICSECDNPMVIKDNQLVSLKEQPGVLTNEPADQMEEQLKKLVTC